MIGLSLLPMNVQLSNVQLGHAPDMSSTPGETAPFVACILRLRSVMYDLPLDVKSAPPVVIGVVSLLQPRQSTSPVLGAVEPAAAWIAPSESPLISIGPVAPPVTLRLSVSR